MFPSSIFLSKSFLSDLVRKSASWQYTGVFAAARISSPRQCLLFLALLATVAHGHGTYHELVKGLDAEITARPNDAALYSRRAFIHLEHGDWQACLIDAERAGRCAATTPAIILLRGRALAAGGKHEAALTVLGDHLKTHPLDAAALMERARVRGALKLQEEAADDFSLAMRQIGKPEPDAVYEHVSLLCAAGRKTAALAVLDAALARSPGLISLVDRAVALELELGKPAAAASRIAALIPDAKIKEPLMAKHAALLAQAGDTEKSLAVWRALQSRIAAMPPQQRGSHAMSKLAEQAAFAISALTNTTNQVTSSR